MGSIPEVSIIIINYNTFALTKASIESIIEHTNNLKYEIILVDNASTEVCASEFLKLFPEIVLIKSPINLGFAKGNNVGIERARGKFILLFNSDAYLQENSIKITYDLLKSQIVKGVATCRILFPDGREQSVCQRFPSVSLRLFQLFRLQKLMPSKKAGNILLGSFFDNKTECFPDWIWGTFFMFPKEILNSLPAKKLDETFFMYGEDMQWCWMFKKLGFKIYYFPQTYIYHHFGASKGGRSKIIDDNQQKFLVQNYSKLEVRLINFLDRLLRIE